jgi:hypothetical protein
MAEEPLESVFFNPTPALPEPDTGNALQHKLHSLLRSRDILARLDLSFLKSEFDV